MDGYALMVEYKIEERHRHEYLERLRELRERWPDVRLYEGSEQPGLFVEIWPAASEAAAKACQEERLDGRSPWSAIGGWTAGGAGRIHAWTFRPAPL
ncbi:hypothetical protein NYE40_18660 [Paenibacillus sp. FSL W8-1187]|uniref:DUF1330 domain-containing protein n=1 Tax=Paenibacillus pasadenensis TaxID=217090 RepID=A0A2N5NAF8_9BACL|nr:hypothetical protein [Paenibacillus pasadenensis]PLT47298.1 hypothetical protein B8V81_1522 [Paenibacillus pasadenensis]